MCDPLESRGLLDVGWPRNGYLVISRNTKLDEIKHFFRGISAEFRELMLFSRNFAEFRGIISNF